MPLTKSVVTDRIEVLETGQLQVRDATVISEDGVELSRTFHRQVLEPGDALDGQSARVVAVAEATWTAQVVADWQAFLAARDE
jgi:hypothetical protein|tara:strand:- start:6 stop:254 length:249 start_codon:yes stop_codon:yes gene_type:complete